MKSTPTRSSKSGFWLALALSGACSACSHYYYAPSDGALLAVSEPGDVKIAAGGDKYKDNTGRNFSVQAAFSPVEHLGVMGSYFHLEKTEKGKSGSGAIADAALGGYWFKKTGRYAKSNWAKGIVTADAYAGYGWGRASNYYATGGQSHLDFRKHFLQLGCHYRHNKSFGQSAGLRYVRLNYWRASLFGEIPPGEDETIHHIRKSDPIGLLELSYRLELGIRHGKFFLAFTQAYASKLKEYDFIDSSAHFGLMLEPDEFFRKNKGAK